MNASDEHMIDEHAKDSRNNSWLASFNLWIVVPSLIAVACLLFLGLRLQSKLTGVRQEAELLISTKSKLEKLVSSKNQLLDSLQDRHRSEEKRIDAMHAGLGFIGQPSDLPIKDGESVFFVQKGRTNGFDVFIYAPEGKHTLTLRVGHGIQHNASFQNVKEKEFVLPESACGQLTVDFQNEGEHCVVSAVLFGINNIEIARESFQVPKRTATGGMIGHSSGTIFYLPGDASSTKNGNYRRNGWHLQKTDEGMLVLSTFVSFESEAKEHFIGIENVMHYLDRIEAMFEPEVKNNRLMLTPEGIKELRKSRSPMFF